MDIKLEFYNKVNYDKKVVKECEDLAYSQHVDNGGTLRLRGLVGFSSSLLCARDENGKIVGFVSLYRDYHFPGDLYVTQIAVSKDCVKQGVASKMIQCIIDNSRGYTCFSADVRFDNIASNALFTKMGFIRNSRNNSYAYALDLRQIDNRKRFEETFKRGRKI